MRHCSLSIVYGHFHAQIKVFLPDIHPCHRCMCLAYAELLKTQNLLVVAFHSSHMDEEEATACGPSCRWSLGLRCACKMDPHYCRYLYTLKQWLPESATKIWPSGVSVMPCGPYRGSASVLTYERKDPCASNTCILELPQSATIMLS